MVVVNQFLHIITEKFYILLKYDFLTSILVIELNGNDRINITVIIFFAQFKNMNLYC